MAGKDRASSVAGKGRTSSVGVAFDGLRASEPGELGREQLSEIQRTRILAAMIEVASEHGAGYATVARVVARSGVSRRTFYEQFVDREDCFLAAFDQAVERIAATVLPAYRQPVSWHEQIRAGLAVLLEFLDFERALGRFVIVETLGAGPMALEGRRLVLAQIVTAVDEGRQASKGSKELPSLTGEGIVGGVFSLIHSRMADEESAPLIELLNPLVSMIVLPYLGVTASRRELERPVPKARNGVGRRARTDPLRDLDMRLTYRTVRTLLAIGAHPGASNRQIADDCGIRDQGQVSKLLTRLQHLELIHNAGDPKARGEPNAWILTAMGAEVREAISLQNLKS